MDSSFDAAEQAKILDLVRARFELTEAEAESLLLDEHPVAPLYFYVSKHLVSPRIGGFEHNALDRHPSRFLYLEDDD